MPKISIIVPVYNTKEVEFRKCMESLTQQTFDDLEILLIDDGSTNEARVLCDEFQLQDSRILAIHQSNQGVAAARNMGLKVATGDWITFVDADDWCEETLCEKALEKAEEFQSDILIFENYLIKENGERVRNQFFASEIAKFSPEQKTEAELKTMVRNHPTFSYQPPYNMLGGTWGKFIRRSFLKETGIRFDVELLRSQDIIFYLYLFEQANVISYLDEPLYHYRYSAESVSKRYRPDAYRIFGKVLQHQEAFIRKYHKSERFWQVYTKGVMTSIATCMRTDVIHEKNPKSTLEKCQSIQKMIQIPAVSIALQNDEYESLTWFQSLQKFMLRKRWIQLYLFLFQWNDKRIKKKKVHR